MDKGFNPVQEEILAQKLGKRNLGCLSSRTIPVCPVQREGFGCRILCDQ
jgi:hypothetical protein